jgi:hypothetical protein
VREYVCMEYRYVYKETPEPQKRDSGASGNGHIKIRLNFHIC